MTYRIKNASSRELCVGAWALACREGNRAGCSLRGTCPLNRLVASSTERYIEQHRENKALLKAIEMAFLSNRKVFQDFEYIQSELKLIPLISNLLEQLGYPDKEDLNGISKFLLYSIDSVIHRHVISEDHLITDEELEKYLSEMVLRFIKFRII